MQDEDEKTGLSEEASASDPDQHYDSRLLLAFKRILYTQSEELIKAIPSHFVNYILASAGSGGALTVCIFEHGYYFKGFPDCDYSKQFCYVLTLWNQMARFPVQFLRLDGFTDDTTHFVEHILSLATPLVHDVFQHLSTNNLYLMERDLKELLIQLGMRGLMTMLGFRKTTGSQDAVWPSKQAMLQSFNQLNTILTEDEVKRLKGPMPRLTVGARAYCKHAHRSSEGFWGTVKGTEGEKNQTAEKVAVSILDEAVWVNVHTLPHSEHIVECRNDKGYGIRWTLKGEFRGFLEPQMEGGHDKRWRH